MFNKTHSDFVDVKGRTLTEVVEDLEAKEVVIEDASTIKKGITQLSNSIDSLDETKAATPKAVKDSADALRLLIKDSPVQSVNGQTGVVVLSKADFELNEVDNVKQAPASHVTDENVHGIGDKALLKTTDKTSIVGAVNELFQSASDGKTAIANAVTAKGVPASPADTFPTLASKIGQISASSGRKFASGTKTATSFRISVDGLGFRPSVVIAKGVESTTLQFTSFYAEIGSTSFGGYSNNSLTFSNANSINGVHDDGFEIYGDNGKTYDWIAYE